jgi:hypothetical protein
MSNSLHEPPSQDTLVRLFLAAVSLLLFSSCAHVDRTRLHQLSPTEQERFIAEDVKALQIYREGLAKIVTWAEGQTNLFSVAALKNTLLPNRQTKEELWQLWKSYLDYLLALEAIEQRHRDWPKLAGPLRNQSYAVNYGAFLAKYRFSVKLIEIVERNSLSDTILNESVPEVGLPRGTYSKIENRYLNGFTATEFGARAVVRETMREGASGEWLQGINADAEALLKMGHGEGELLTLKNALKIVQRAGDTVWFPIQAGVSEWMGDTKVYRPGRSLISAAQIEQLKLLPGDVLLVRHEWYLSNIGLPGFWPHAALYIGTPEERSRFFADPEVTGWTRSQGGIETFEQLLQGREEEAYLQSLKPLEKGHDSRILEAVSDGVSFTALEHCADADSLVILRPLLSKKERAIALLRAFHYAGRPYDFNFDFATDSELVCTELVFKCYEPGEGFHGLRLPLVDMLGRKLLPANEIVRQFDEQYRTNQAQFAFITFLDGREDEGKAIEATLGQFRQSWRRPKWHILKKEK